MSQILTIETHVDERGKLGVVEDFNIFPIKRVFWVYGMKGTPQRGKHLHKSCSQFLVCLQGWVRVNISIDPPLTPHLFSTHHVLEADKNKGLLLTPGEFLEYTLSEDGILLVLASEYYMPEECVSYAQEDIVYSIN